MNETHEKRTTQPFGTFFNLIYTVALLISRLLHPVSVKGLENLPRNGALLIANHSSNWDPILLATALPRDYRLRVMAKEELFRYPVVSWLIRVGGAFPVNRGGADIQAVKTAMQSIRDGQNLLILPGGNRDPGRHRQGGRPAGSCPQRRGDDRASAPALCLCRYFWTGKAAVSQDPHHHRQALYAGIYPAARGTAEEMQNIADDLLREIYALGGQQVGGAPL